MPRPGSGAKATAERLRQELGARGFELLSAPDVLSAGALDLDAGRLHAFKTRGHGIVHVLVPVQLHVHLNNDGGLTDVGGGEPSRDDLRSARGALDDLIANGRLDDPASPLRTRCATHTLVTETDGRRVLRRRGFDLASGVARS